MAEPPQPDGCGELPACFRRAAALRGRNIAKVLSWAGKTEDAARAARLALAELGEDAECSFILGAEASEFGRWDDAMLHYREALRHEPEDVAIQRALARALRASGQRADLQHDLEPRDSVSAGPTG